MTLRSGLGLIDIVALSAVAPLGHPERPHVKASKLVDAVDEATGLGPGPSYDLLLEHARDWVVPLCLVEFHGNLGSPEHPAAAPRYVEARLSRAGLIALDAEAGRCGPVPIGLILGNTHRGGTRPPFDPQRLIGALRHLLDHPTADDDRLVALVGAPAFPTACDIDGDIDSVYRGEARTVTLRARVSQVGETPFQVLVENLPPTTTVTAALEAIRLKVDRPWKATHPKLANTIRNPIGDAQDISDQHGIRIRCVGRADATFDDIQRYLRRLNTLGLNWDLQLSQPLPDLLREWTSRAPHDDLANGLHRLATLL